LKAVPQVLCLRRKIIMKMPVLLVAIVLVTGIAHGSQPCDAAIEKVAKALAAARAMSDVNKPAKCRALILIPLQSDVGLVCTAPEDVKIVEDKYLPLAKSAGDEAVKVCPK
jgi:hypothetical protein